jgi:hypothetical protein
MPSSITVGMFVIGMIAVQLFELVSVHCGPAPSPFGNRRVAIVGGRVAGHAPNGRRRVGTSSGRNMVVRSNTGASLMAN